MDIKIVTATFGFKILIDDKVHLFINHNEFIGFQSWIDPENKYPFVIEFYVKSKDPILCEYGNRALWEEILKKLNTSIGFL